jgi:hypothetical protein
MVTEYQTPYPKKRPQVDLAPREASSQARGGRDGERRARGPPSAGRGGPAATPPPSRRESRGGAAKKRPPSERKRAFTEHAGGLH